METGIFEAVLSDTNPAAAKQQSDRGQAAAPTMTCRHVVGATASSRFFAVNRGQAAAPTLARRSPTGVVVYAESKPLAKEFNENVVGTAQGGMNYHDCR